MFDDPIVEIQELTLLIKNEITTLNVALTDLQTIQNMEMADGNYSQDKVVHSTAVCDDLKSKLMGATKQLQDVLTARTEVSANFVFNAFYCLTHNVLIPYISCIRCLLSSQNIKAHENRRQIFSKNTTRENTFGNQAKTLNEPLPWSSSSNAHGGSQPSA